MGGWVCCVWAERGVPTLLAATTYLLQLLVGEVDAELLEGVDRERFKAEHIKQPDKRRVIDQSARAVLLVHLHDRGREEVSGEVGQGGLLLGCLLLLTCMTIQSNSLA